MSAGSRARQRRRHRDSRGYGDPRNKSRGTCERRICAKESGGGGCFTTIADAAITHAAIPDDAGNRYSGECASGDCAATHAPCATRASYGRGRGQDCLTASPFRHRIRRRLQDFGAVVTGVVGCVARASWPAAKGSAFTDCADKSRFVGRLLRPVSPTYIA